MRRSYYLGGLLVACYSSPTYPLSLMAALYLDANGTTPCSASALEAALPYFTACFGNPSTAYGADAAAALARARAQLCSLLSTSESAVQVIFEGCATESINHVIKGLCMSRVGAARGGGHIVAGGTEHPAVAEALKFCEAHYGVRVTRVAPCPRTGGVPAAAVAAALCPGETFLVTCMLANNETGAITDLSAVSRAVRAGAPGAFLHTDASQAVGKVPIDFGALGVDALTLAGHKFHAPKGIGATVVARAAAGALTPLLHGGGQEGGARAGTENVPLAVALGEAAAAAQAWLGGGGGEHLATLRGTLARRLLELCTAKGAPPPVFTLPSLAPPQALPAVGGHHHPSHWQDSSSSCCLPNTLSLAWPGLSSTGLKATLLARGLVVAAGAACHSSSSSSSAAGGSAVLSAMGIPHAQAAGTLRLSLLRSATAEEVEGAAQLIASAVGEAWAQRAQGAVSSCTPATAAGGGGGSAAARARPAVSCQDPRGLDVSSGCGVLGPLLRGKGKD